MHDPNYEHSTRLTSRSVGDRRAIRLAGDLLLSGVWLERRLIRALTPRRVTHGSSSFRAPAGRRVQTGVMQFSPLRREGA